MNENKGLGQVMDTLNKYIYIHIHIHITYSYYLFILLIHIHITYKHTWNMRLAVC